TGWNVAAQLRWLWVAVSEQVTFCDILPGRGFDEAASILGADYKGWLTHDGWQVYYKFLKAGHQSCLNHLLDRAKKLIESASARARTGAATAPHGELAPRPCSPAFCKRPSSKAKSPSLFCWNYSVAGTSTRFSIWCQGPEKPLRIPRGRRRRAGDSCRRRQRVPFRGSS